MFKKLLLAATMLCFFVPALHAQTSINRTWFSIYGGHNAYDGDLGNEMLEYKSNSDWSGGIGFHQYLSPSFDLDLNVEYGYLDYKNQKEANPLKSGTSFGSKYVSAAAMLRYKLANGYIFSEESFLQPFLGIGVGGVPFFDGDANLYANGRQEIKNRIGFNVPLQAGFDFRLSPKFKLFLRATYNRTFVDGPDGVGNSRFSGSNASGRGDLDNVDHDDFLVTSFGVKFNVGGAKDSDGDGIINEDDRCPEVAGSAENQGCPDSDGDGVIDKVDRCPDVAGTAELNGCPDSDGDGIADGEDRCPQVAGDKANDGCPDADGDGVIDSEDRCPNVAGKAEFDGCPDSDGDGIVDSQDECPQTAGTEENNGCPEANFEFSDINFQFDKSFIEDQYKSELDSVAGALNDDSGLKVELTGHADRIGPAQYNLRLSKRRAESVRDYLTGQDVEDDRITTNGVGETQPKVTDANEEQRRQNRRVVIETSHN